MHESYLLQSLTQPDSGCHHHINLMDNDNGNYSYSKSLHNEVALTITTYTELGQPGEKVTFGSNNKWRPVSSAAAKL